MNWNRLGVLYTIIIVVTYTFFSQIKYNTLNVLKIKEYSYAIFCVNLEIQTTVYWDIPEHLK